MDRPWVPASTAQINVQLCQESHFDQALAERIVHWLEMAIVARGQAVLSLSGGKSPVGLFHALSMIRLDWQKVVVTLVDDRCLPEDHPDSNAGLIRQHLLRANAQAARFQPLVPVDAVFQRSAELPHGPSQQDLQQWADQAGQQLAQIGPADVLVLGMGTDGHTASWFPTARNLAEALDLNRKAACLAMDIPDLPSNAPYPRLSQTLSQVLISRHLVLPIRGEDKRRVLQAAWAGPLPGLPVSYVLHQNRAPVQVWLAQ